MRLLHTKKLSCVVDLQTTTRIYHIVTPRVAGTYFNVRIQINQSEGHVGFYYNPSWGGQPDADSDIAFAGNAVWGTGMLLRTVLTALLSIVQFLSTCHAAVGGINCLFSAVLSC